MSEIAKPTFGFDGAVPPESATYAKRSLDDIKAKAFSALFRGMLIEEVNKLPEASRRIEIRLAIERILDEEESLLTLQERTEIVEDLLDDILGLGPLEKLLRDSSVSDILINSAKVIFVERRGRLEEADVVFRNDQHLLHVIERIVSRVGRRVDESSPMVDARLADGSRVNAIVPPLALDGPAMSIRRFGKSPLRLANLIAYNSLSPEMAMLLEAATQARQSLVISGGTGSGKTTLLNAFSAFIPAHERIITIEDAAELQLQRRHVVRLETRPPNIEGKGQITMRDLVRNALRMRPDRIIIGECRGGEALDMLQAMNTGHEGSMTTLHANSPRDALGRLETMVMMSGFEMPIKVMRHQISSALRLVVQADRVPGGGRKVTSITEVVGMEGDVIIMQEIFAYRQRGVDDKGRARGYFEATGVRPQLAVRLRAAGVEVPPDLFAQRVLLED
ncbi:MAG TPA: CpaF family protein [Gemmatales bacterium]|nr:CpaF family protein [Gemmatales bacterium]HMP59504.1 CpaF family protein [Gemmatales bacterium]